jgi:hypothetical protein
VHSRSFFEAIVVASLADGKLSCTVEAGRLTDNHQKRITTAIEETSYYDLKEGPSRFYLVDSFIPTDARKTSPGGIMGLRYLDLSNMVPAYNPQKYYTTAELAEALKQATWE